MGSKVVELVLYQDNTIIWDPSQKSMNLSIFCEIPMLYSCNNSSFWQKSYRK